MAAATFTGSLFLLALLGVLALELLVEVFFALAGAFTLADLGEVGFVDFLTARLEVTAAGRVTTFLAPFVGNKLQDQAPLSSDHD